MKKVTKEKKQIDADRERLQALINKYEERIRKEIACGRYALFLRHNGLPSRRWTGANDFRLTQIAFLRLRDEFKTQSSGKFAITLTNEKIKLLKQFLSQNKSAKAWLKDLEVDHV